MKIRNFTSVKDRYEVNQLSMLELLKEAAEFNNAMKSKEPFYYRLSKNGNCYTLYNEVGEIVATEVKEVDALKLTPVKIHKQFNHTCNDATLEFYKYRLAHMLRLKVFLNGNFPVETKSYINRLLKSLS